MQTIKQLIFIFLLLNSRLSGQVYLSNSNSYSDDNGTLYWIGTVAFSVINGTTTYFNFKKLHKYDKYRSNAIFGGISGGVQTALGVITLNKNQNNLAVPSSINVAIGLTTLITSVIRLATKNPAKENRVSMNFIYQPNYNNYNSTIGLVFKKQF